LTANQRFAKSNCSWSDL